MIPSTPLTARRSSRSSRSRTRQRSSSIVAELPPHADARGLAFRRFSKEHERLLPRGGKGDLVAAGRKHVSCRASAPGLLPEAPAPRSRPGWSLSVMMFSNGARCLCRSAANHRTLVSSTPVCGRGPTWCGFDLPRMEQFHCVPWHVHGTDLWGRATLWARDLHVDSPRAEYQRRDRRAGFVVLFYSALSGAWAVLAADSSRRGPDADLGVARGPLPQGSRRNQRSAGRRSITRVCTKRFRRSSRRRLSQR